MGGRELGLTRWAPGVYRGGVSSRGAGGSDRSRRARYPARLVVRMESARLERWREWARTRGVGVSAMVRVAVDEVLQQDAKRGRKP